MEESEAGEELIKHDRTRSFCHSLATATMIILGY